MIDYNLLPKTEIERKSGVYIISNVSSPSSKLNTKVLVKIGRALDLKKRLDNYHTCFPASFWTWSIIRCSKANYTKLEKLLHAKLKKFEYLHPQYQPRISGTEWFQLTKRQLRTVLNEILFDELTKKKGIITTVFNPHPYHFKLNPLGQM